MQQKLPLERQKSKTLSQANPKINVKKIKEQYKPADLLKQVHEKITNQNLLLKAKKEHEKKKEDEDGWTFIQRDPNLAVVDGDLVVLDPEALGTMFIWLDDSDVLDAVAFCVAQSIISMPRVKNLPHDKLMTMVNTAFFSIRNKCVTEKIWDWGKFMYSVYGWATIAETICASSAIRNIILTTLVIIGF
jgi:hypothetical protein